MERTSKIEVRAGESLSGAIARTQAENEPANLRKQVNDIQQALGTAQELSAAWAEKARQYELELEGDPQNLHGKGRTFGLRSQLATLQARNKELDRTLADVYQQRDGLQAQLARWKEALGEWGGLGGCGYEGRKYDPPRPTEEQS